MNYFTDNEDLTFIFETTDLSNIVRMYENGFREKDMYDYAPDSVEDARCFDPEVYSDIADDDLKELMTVPRSGVEDLLGSLADAKISLSLRDFMKIVMGKRFGAVENQVGPASAMLPGIFGSMCKKPLSALDNMSDCELGHGVLPLPVRDMIAKLVPSHSVADEPAGRRVTITVIRGNGPVALKRAEVVTSDDLALAEKMATVYAMYKLAFCRRVNDRVAMRRAILQHYV